MEKLYFIVGSGLKNLMGKDSIIDRNVAIFELVKNSIDAKAKEIQVNFYGEKQPDGTNIINKIEVLDNGKGMGLDDIRTKWLKVAYSAKKEGMEDDAGMVNSYAGEKGVGRFACDTLGSELDLFATRKNDEYVNHICIDWTDFERDANLDFQEIPLSYEKQTKDFPHGVRISITGIRGTWSRDDLKKLRRGLTKIVQPKMEGDTSIGPRIFLNTNFEEGTYKDGDDIKTYYNSVNGEIKSFAFAELDKKVISIQADISKDGKYLEVSLFDKGEEVYYFKQSNEYILLKGLSVKLSFLDQGAKKSFNSLTGLNAKDYGSIFLYRNGFRILPYGTPGDDSFKIDLRKAQGYSRFLGNREILGQILIPKEADGFMETANRDSGFIQNSSFQELNHFLIDMVIARFEKYIRAVKWYGLDEIIADEDGEDSHIGKVSEDIAKVIASITKIKGIIDFRFSQSVAQLISSESDPEMLFRQVKDAITNTGGIDEKIAVVRKLETKMKAYDKQNKKIQKVIKEKDKKLTQAVEKIAEQEKTNKFLLASTRNSIAISELAHNLKNYSSGLQGRLSYMSNILRGKEVDTNDLLETISECSILASKIDKFVQFASIANFDLQSSEKKGDLIGYIKEYISEGRSSMMDDYIGWTINYTGLDQYITKFTPMDISIVLDNLFSNARKALRGMPKNSNKIINIRFSNWKSDGIHVSFTNFGSYVPEQDRERIFRIGVTTTSGGSGLGLAIVKRIIGDNNGTITCDSENQADTIQTTFNIYLPKNA